MSEGVREIMNKTCPTCDGEGVVRSEETIAIDVERGLRKLAKESRAEAFLVQVHPRVAAILIGGGGKPLRELEEETGKLFHFQGTEGIPLDTFEIIAEGSRDEIEDRALPFKQGEEVLIRIEEPHMYNVDDAIAKIDGYVISISGGGPFVGESKLIKIDEVQAHGGLREHRDQQRRARARPRDDERTRTRPQPSGAGAAEQDAAEAGRRRAEDDGEPSYNRTAPRARRRRGRRGGRRRSARSGQQQRLEQSS